MLRRLALRSGLLLAAGLSSCQRETPRTEPAPLGTPLARSEQRRSESHGEPAPAPVRSPAPIASANTPPPAPRERGVADVDPDNDDVVAPPDPIEDCASRLTELGAEFQETELPLRKRRGTELTCGSANAVIYERGPGGITYVPRPILDCGMAIALARADRVLQEEAERHLGAKILRVGQKGTYSCRDMAAWDMVSEHSYANAIDLTSFRLADGRRVTVEKHFGKPTNEPTSDAGRFLRSAARRLYDENVFSVVLTAFFDRLHRDHFHLDLARYRVDGTR